MKNCPCLSGNSYENCCEPVINKKSAPTALSLMRSRYTAYYYKDAEYLYNTTHPNTRIESSISEINSWAKENNWTRLEIVATEKGKKEDNEGTVEFKAYYIDKNGKNQIHHEKSTFIKEAGSWFYVEGVANPRKTIASSKTLRNDPCPCGSGKKFKKCCG